MFQQEMLGLNSWLLGHKSLRNGLGRMQYLSAHQLNMFYRLDDKKIILGRTCLLWGVLCQDYLDC